MGENKTTKDIDEAKKQFRITNNANKDNVKRVLKSFAPNITTNSGDIEKLKMSEL